MADAALEVHGLHKRYSSVQALRGLSFTVPRGAFFGLFGRNGAGKKTALDIASGLLTRDSRVKESKKYGLKRARKAPQYTKR